MRGISIRLAKVVVEPQLRGCERMLRHRHPCSPEAWSPDRDKEGCRGEWDDARSTRDGTEPSMQLHGITSSD
jgi:hypothetical protein